MYNYTCLNPIAGVGLDLFSEDYKKVDELAGDKGYVTINEVQLALGLQTPQKAQAIVKAAGYVKTDENVDGKAVWKK